MHRLTIIPSDGAVYLQENEQSELQVWLELDLSFVPSDVHALQWHVDSGWIEHTNVTNVDITELPQWADQSVDLALNQIIEES